MMKIILFIEVVFTSGLHYHPSQSITDYDYNYKPSKIAKIFKLIKILTDYTLLILNNFIR